MKRKSAMLISNPKYIFDHIAYSMTLQLGIEPILAIFASDLFMALIIIPFITK